MDMSGLAAETGSASIVEPSQVEIIHPPDLGLRCNGDVDPDVCQVLENRVKNNWAKSATVEWSASWNSMGLEGD